MAPAESDHASPPRSRRRACQPSPHAAQDLEPGSFTADRVTLGLKRRKCLADKGGSDLLRARFFLSGRHFAGEAYFVASGVVCHC
jgi:hypothetical protein